MAYPAPLLLVAALLSLGSGCMPQRRSVSRHMAVEQAAAHRFRSGSLDAPQQAGRRGTHSAPAASRLIRPCRIHSTEWKLASAKLEQIDRTLASLSAGADPAPILKELSELGQSPCFEIGGRLNFDDPEAERPDSVLSLREFWKAGARAFIEGYLNLAASGTHRPFVWSTPGVRKTLSLESAPHHPLAFLLCSEQDRACIESSAAFRKRGQAWMDLDSERTRLERWQSLVGSAKPGDPLAAVDFYDCAKRVTSLPEQARFDAWLECLEVHAPQRWSFPWVGLMRPKRGWLILTGRRGHYQFCDEVRAYDLATGAAFVVGSCSQLELQDGGSVDHRATDARRAMQAHLGFIPPLSLQEALWFLLTAPELEQQPEAIGETLPAGVTPIRPEASHFQAGLWLPSLCGSSADTRVFWNYVLDGELRASGALTWPGCGWELKNQYAVQLVSVAESLMEESCAPTLSTLAVSTILPGALRALTANGLDSDVASLSLAAQQIERTWRELGKKGSTQPTSLPECGSPRAPSPPDANARRPTR